MRPALLLSLALAGCAGAPLPASSPLRFAACGELECARARVPYDWACAGGACDDPAVELLVRRLRAPGAARGQLWALDGGPGFSGESFFDPAFVAIVHGAGYDLYVPSHRGTPGSDGLHCPREEAADSPAGGRVTDAELPACRASLEARWGTLAHFSSPSAGQDVAHLVSRAPEAERRVLFGGSYGTLWGQRALQAAPDAFDLAWFDSVVSLEASLENADRHADAAARALLSQCEASGACPLDTARALAVLRAHDAGEGCAQSSGAELRALGFRLLSGDIQERLVFVELLARAERCDATDRVALDRALEHFRAPSSGGPAMPYAPLLNVHVVASELDHGAAPSPQDTLIASRGGDSVLRARNDAWGRQPLSASGAAETSARVVLLSGGLDPLDPPEWAQATAERWGAELIEVPSAGHAVMRYMRTTEGNCGHSILSALLAQPQAAINRACLAEVEGIDWSRARPETAESLSRWFGD